MAIEIGRGRFRLALLQGLTPLDPARIPAEVIAGVTLASIAIPEVMGYTKISGTPVITGLYTMLLPALLYAVLGSSRHLVVGADSATAAILASGLAVMSISGPEHYVALSSLLALMTGALLLVARILRLGFLANFLSRSVLIGFLTGVGIQVAMGEAAGLFGVHVDARGALAKAYYLVTHLGEIHIGSSLLAVAVLATILALARFLPRLPGPLIAVAGAIVVSWLFDLSGHGIEVLGALPAGLPPFALPDLEVTRRMVLDLVPIAMSMVVVILTQSAATSRAYGERYNERVDENTDLIGLAAANIGAGLTGTFVVNGSPTKTEILDAAGGRNQVAILAMVATVLLVLTFFTAPLAYLPQTVLSVLVFLIGIKLIDIKGMKLIYQQARTEFWVASATAATVVLVNVKQGILLALVLSLVDHIRSSYRPKNYVAVKPVDGEWEMRPLDQARTYAPGLLIYHFTHSLYYANARAMEDDLGKLEARFRGKVSWLCIDASAISDVDFSAAQTLRSVTDRLLEADIQLVFTHVSPHVMHQFETYGLIEHWGRHRFYANTRAMLNAHARATGDD